MIFLQFTTAIGTTIGGYRPGSFVSIRTDYIETILLQDGKDSDPPTCVITTISGDKWTVLHTYQEVIRVIREYDNE